MPDYYGYNMVFRALISYFFARFESNRKSLALDKRRAKKIALYAEK